MMKHNLIKRNNYLLVVDDTEITVKDWTYSPMNGIILISSLGLMISIDRFTKKIISHLPLNGAAVLTGVPLLPSLYVNDFEYLLRHTPMSEIQKEYGDDVMYNLDVFIKGYNKCHERYKYTEEHLKVAIEMAQKESWDEGGYLGLEHKPNEIIQSLQHPKLPISFECEVITREQKPNTITNSEGRIQWVGKYIYE